MRTNDATAVVQGYIIGALSGLRHPFVKVAESDPERGEIILSATESKHRFRVTVEEIGGEQ